MALVSNCVFLLLLGSIAAGADLNSGLVAYYPFNGNANDASGNGHNATANGVTFSTDRFGQANQSVQFAGNNSSFVEVPNSSGLFSPSAYTVSLWAYIEDGGTDSPRFFSKGWNIFEACVNLHGPQPKQVILLEDGHEYFSSTSLVNSNWYFIAFVDDGITSSIYINGILDQAFVHNRGSIPIDSDNLFFGMNSGHSADNMLGKLESVRIYNRALSAAEVQQLYNVSVQVYTYPASSITDISATLNGSVNPNGLATTAYFQWGTSTSYGNTVPTPTLSCGSGNSTLNVSVQNLSGLAPSTTYHYRLVANFSAGTDYGTDQSFTTLSAGPLSTVSATLSTLTVAPNSAPADGVSTITATVILKEWLGNPIAGRAVTFHATEENASGLVAGSPSFSQSANQTTDGSGKATVSITANIPGILTITATDTTDAVGVQQPATALFTPPGATPVKTPQDLSNAINTFYQATLNLLSGSGSYNTPTTPSFSVTPIPLIASDEGQVGNAFEVAATAAKADKIVDAVFGAFGVVSSLPNSLTLNGQVAVDLVAETENLLADNIDWIATNADGLGLEAQAVLNVATLNHNSLQGQMPLLNAIPQSSANMVTLYTNDLQKRLYADYVLMTVLGQEDGVLDNLQRALKARALTSTLEGIGLCAGGVALTVWTAGWSDIVAASIVGGGYSIATTGLAEYEDNQSFDDNQKAYFYGFCAMQACAGYSTLIYSNAISAFSQIALGITPSVVTGSISKLQPYVQNNVVTLPSDSSSGFQPEDGTTTYPNASYPTSAYSIVTVSNAGPRQATFQVFTCFNSAADALTANTSLPLVNVANLSLDAHESSPVFLCYLDGAYGAAPAEGSTVSIYVLGLNTTGIFYVAGTNFTWPSQALGPSVVNYLMQNPVRYFVTEAPNSQTYSEQVFYCNPFFGDLKAVVTQTIPSGVNVLNTDGSYEGSSITWSNMLSANGVTNGTFEFTLSALPGSPTNLPAPSIVFMATNSSDSVAITSPVQTFSGISPVEASGSIALSIAGVDIPMRVSVTNLTSVTQTGILTISITNLTGIGVTNVSESFSVNALAATNVDFTLPGLIEAGTYSFICSLSINGGTGQVLAGAYVVPAPPVMLNLGLTPALTTNGLSLVLQGPPGNYVIEASSDISSPTNWEALLFYATTNSPFYYYFNDSTATNFNQRFYRALMQ